MNKNYKFLLKKLVFNKLRNIYIKINSKSKKQYLKYKGKMINIRKYKKIQLKKKLNKKYIKTTLIRGGGRRYKELWNEYVYNIYNQLMPYLDILKAHGDVALITYLRENNHELFSNLPGTGNSKSKLWHIDLLITILLYIYKYYEKHNVTYKKTLKLLQNLVMLLEGEAITGIYEYGINDNIFTINDRTPFSIIKTIVNKFRERDGIYIDSFEKNVGKTLNENNIVIANTTISIVIQNLLPTLSLTTQKYTKKRYSPLT